jgi:Metal binding domain of Ada
MTRKQYRLVGPDGHDVLSDVPGRLGGNRRKMIYGQLACRSAVGALATGYAKVRVFFADEATAIAAGYRPCATCMRKEYEEWTQRTSRPRRR